MRKFVSAAIAAMTLALMTFSSSGFAATATHTPTRTPTPFFEMDKAKLQKSEKRGVIALYKGQLKTTPGMTEVTVYRRDDRVWLEARGWRHRGTRTPTVTKTATPTSTVTLTATPTATFTVTMTATPTGTFTETMTATPTATPTETPTFTFTNTP